MSPRPGPLLLLSACLIEQPLQRKAFLKHVASAFSILCVCGQRSDCTILTAEVLYVGRNMLIICLLVFHSVTHLT